jgi:hypothetical protein
VALMPANLNNFLRLAVPEVKIWPTDILSPLLTKIFFPTGIR